jgi:hypothetical protein
MKTPECGAPAGDDGGDQSRCSRRAGGGFGVGPAADGGGRSWWFCYLPWGPFLLSSSRPLLSPLNADSLHYNVIFQFFFRVCYFSVLMREIDDPT